MRFRQTQEISDYLVCFRARTLVFLNRLQQIGSPTIVQEEDALPDTPEWRCPELAGAGQALGYAVPQPSSHVVKQQIGIKISHLQIECLEVALVGLQRGGVAHPTTHGNEVRIPTDG